MSNKNTRSQGDYRVEPHHIIPTILIIGVKVTHTVR